MRISGNDQSRNINVEIFPFKDPVQAKRYFLITFEEVFPSSLAKKERTGFELWNPGRRKQADGNQQLIQLKQELAATIEYQQSIIEQRETANEELRAANEEIQSSNEELQSMQEEMETAKEELQATNEELTTVNDELRKRILELSEVNSDLNNLLSSINIPIVILGNDLRIRRITAMAEKVLNLISTDVGRPLSDIKPNIDLPQLEQLILEVINTLAIKEQEVRDRWGHWYSLCIRPYRTLDNKIDGVVLILFDISTVKLNQEQVQISCDYAAITEAIREPFLVLDAELRVKLANRSFYQTFRVSPMETEHQSIFALGNGQWNISALRALLEEILPKDTSFSDYKVEHDFPLIGRKVMLLNARRVNGKGKLTPLILLAFEDITAK